MHAPYSLSLWSHSIMFSCPHVCCLPARCLGLRLEGSRSLSFSSSSSSPSLPGRRLSLPSVGALGWGRGRFGGRMGMHRQSRPSRIKPAHHTRQRDHTKGKGRRGSDGLTISYITAIPSGYGHPIYIYSHEGGSQCTLMSVYPPRSLPPPTPRSKLSSSQCPQHLLPPVLYTPAVM